MSQLNQGGSGSGSGSGGGGSGGKIIKSLIGGFMKKQDSGSGGGNPLMGLLGGGAKRNSSSSGNPLGDILGGDDPLQSMLEMLGGLGLEGQESVTSSGAPAYKPSKESLSEDRAVLVTGCQAHETSVS